MELTHHLIPCRFLLICRFYGARLHPYTLKFPKKPNTDFGVNWFSPFCSLSNENGRFD